MTTSNRFKEWYSKNKEALNAKRRERYKKDEALRAKTREQQAKYRANNPRKSTAGAPLYREVNGTLIRVFRIGEAARLVGRKEQVLRKWERDGLTPKPTLEGKQRYYTEVQVVLLRELAQLIDQVRYTNAVTREIALTSKTEELNSKWHQGG